MSSSAFVDFKEIRQTANFRLVLKHFQIQAPTSGSDFKVKCPFHDDHRPSCSINTAKNVFQCFSCGEKGNILEFVLKVGGFTHLKDAALTLARDIMEQSTEYQPGEKKKKVETSTPKIEPKRGEQTLNV